MTRALVALGLAASVVVLAGCGAAPPLPDKITPAEAQEQVDRSNREWWAGMFPDEPMPTVRVVETVVDSNRADEVRACLEAAQIEGVEIFDNGWSAGSTEASNAIMRANFVCTLRFPRDLSDPVALGMLSDAESEWLYNFNTKRLVPCLQLLGYRVANTSLQWAPEQRGYWVPYDDMRPIPTDAEWAQIDAAGPPAPIGPDTTDRRPSRG